MARGKIQIKKIENRTNRQVTYSKRRNGLFKKANELSVLCDAKVSIIMLSANSKLHEYISPTTTTKQLLDEYQQATGVDLWNSHYENMQGQLKQLKEVNRNLTKEIRQMMGESLEELNYEQLVKLMEQVDESRRAIYERKLITIDRQIQNHRRKFKNCEYVHQSLMLGLNARQGDPDFGFVDNGRDYNGVFGLPNGQPNLLGLRLQQNQPSFHSGGRSDLTFALN